MRSGKKINPELLAYFCMGGGSEKIGPETIRRPPLGQICHRILKERTRTSNALRGHSLWQ
jgi:hypothetical protein